MKSATISDMGENGLFRTINPFVMIKCFCMCFCLCFLVRTTNTRKLIPVSNLIRLQFLVVFNNNTTKSLKASGDVFSSSERCPTFDSLDKDGNSLITADEAAELKIGWIMGDGGQVDREEWEDIKMEIKGC